MLCWVHAKYFQVWCYRSGTFVDPRPWSGLSQTFLQFKRLTYCKTYAQPTVLYFLIYPDMILLFFQNGIQDPSSRLLSYFFSTAAIKGHSVCSKEVKKISNLFFITTWQSFYHNNHVKSIKTQHTDSSITPMSNYAQNFDLYDNHFITFA